MPQNVKEKVEKAINQSGYPLELFVTSSLKKKFIVRTSECVLLDVI